MHSRRRELAFVLGLSLIVVAVFAVAMVRMPNWIFGVFLGLFTVLSLLLGYRVFVWTDAMYRAKESREKRWYARHPRLTVLLNLLGIAGFVWLVVRALVERFW